MYFEIETFRELSHFNYTKPYTNSASDSQGKLFYIPFFGLSSDKLMVSLISVPCVELDLCLYYDRDRDNMSAIVAPLDVNVEAPPSRHRHNSVVSSSGAEASVTTTTLKGSPTSTRSVNFLPTYDEVIGRSKRYKRQSVSVGDSIHEHAVRTLERASVTSFAGDDVVSVGGSVRRGHSRRKTSPLRTSETSPATRHCSSISVECVTNAVPNYAVDGLTEVENDRPKVSVVTPCSQQEKRVATVTPGHGAGMSGDTSCPDGRNVQFPLRRRSCEIAMQDGRVSSTTNLKIV